MSTAIELLGFALFVAAAFIWQSVPLEVVTGLVTAGAVLLLVGYATDDRAAVVAVNRIVEPLRARRARRKADRAEKMRGRRERSSAPREARG